MEKDRDQERGRSDRPPRGGVARFAAALRNGLEIARHGGIGEREPSPFVVHARGENHRLRHYFRETESREAELEKRPSDADGETAPSQPSDRTPVLFIPPLMMSAELWDVAPNASAVSTLHRMGFDPWVVDFGSPEQEEGGLSRTLTDHVVAVSDAIASVRRETGRNVHLLGYSQGGMFAYQAAAYLHCEGVASIVTFGSGVDLHRGLPDLLPTELVIGAIEGFSKIQQAVSPSGIPSWATRLGFQLMDPIKTLQQRIDFARRLYDREALKKREGMRRFMESEGWTAFPGPALADLLKQLVAQNRLLQGGLVIDGLTVTLADITCPILAFVGTKDAIAPPPTVRAIYAAAPDAKCYSAKIPTGHFGLVVGSTSAENTWPVVEDWLHWSEGTGRLPEQVTRLVERPEPRRSSTPVEDLRAAAELAWDLTGEMMSELAQGLGEGVGILGRLATNVAPQLPRLSRLAEIRSDTRISPGESLRERAQKSPNDTFFLFEGRAHSYRAADLRIDNIVRGLILCGVHQGQHVGLLMQTRPSAVAATVALSRLGAVAVLLRPDLPLAGQLEVAPVEHVLSDPEHAEAAHSVLNRPILVLGGGGDARSLGPGLVDMEAIDPDAVELPEWYSPNPGTAGELSLVLITGDGTHLGTSRITNRRWATSAYGTASSCALTSRDNVYCCSPTHHATGILVCVGGALVSGARLAMAAEFDTALDPKIFWQDVRRYGVNVVFYSGALAGTLVNAPASQQERHHSIRLFAGSGMPKGLWRRVVDRFNPATVVEFFASSEGNAVLVNLTGEKIGSLGRPLPGAADLEIAAWDLEHARLIVGPTGFAERCQPGTAGLLLERVDRKRGEIEGRPLRGVFEAGDAWLDTGDLVRIDADGDYWLVDPVADVIQTAGGAVTTIPVEDALSSALDFVDLVAVYGVRLPNRSHEIPVAAITIRPGEKVDPVALRRVVERRLPTFERPVAIRLVESLPMTAGHRTRKRELRREALGLDGASGETLWLAPDSPGYVPLASADQIV